ncbi:MAG: prolyl oligopeptidase family serine peptidase [Muribaculaceae bacterium]|nr:prolyl oligopeptidase family serine peptidase [Muribaculaceae bacterium]
MEKRIVSILCVLASITCSGLAAKVNTEKQITVGGKERKYILYVPDNVKENAPLVVSLHGASGHDTDRSPFRTSVADAEGCIVVYPQGIDQFFPVFGGYIPGWNASGEVNEETEFFKAIIKAVNDEYDIDLNRVYCCGFSNGGMMTYANASAAADIFAAFASISGFPLNEFHQHTVGERPVPFLHIHGKQDDFVKYSCMPVIRDNMVARNGCDPVPEVTVVDGRYTKSIYEAGDGGFPYVYYEIDGMGHNDFTDKTEEGNSAQTMWNFMSQYRLNDPCDRTLKWRLNIDSEGFDPRLHNWKISNGGKTFRYGIAKKENNADNNVYPSLQFNAGNYRLMFESNGTEGNKIQIQLKDLNDNSVLLNMLGEVGKPVVMPFSVDKYSEYKITIVKDNAEDKFKAFAIHSSENMAEALNSEITDADPDANVEEEGGALIEIPQDQGRQYDDFARAKMEEGPEYTTYTATGDLQIAMKMMDIDVKDCDYVLIKFAEPVEVGWRAAFWSGTETVEVPAYCSEFKFELEPSMVQTGILPQICLMTLWGAPNPLVAKVSGVYKHSIIETPGKKDEIKTSDPQGITACYSLSGQTMTTMIKGLNIIRQSDGTTKKVLVKSTSGL